MTIAVLADHRLGRPQNAFSPNLGKALEQVRPNSMEAKKALDREPLKVPSWLLCSEDYSFKCLSLCVPLHFIISIIIIIIIIIVIIIIFIICIFIIIIIIVIIPIQGEGCGADRSNRASAASASCHVEEGPRASPATPGLPQAGCSPIRASPLHASHWAGSPHAGECPSRCDLLALSLICCTLCYLIML